MDPDLDADPDPQHCEKRKSSYLGENLQVHPLSETIMR
jgi:hypothetical protein